MTAIQLTRSLSSCSPKFSEGANLNCEPALQKRQSKIKVDVQQWQYLKFIAHFNCIQLSVRIN